MLILGDALECQAESVKTRAQREAVVRMNVQFIRRVFEAFIVIREAIWIAQIWVVPEYILVCIPQYLQHLKVISPQSSQIMNVRRQVLLSVLLFGWEATLSRKPCEVNERNLRSRHEQTLLSMLSLRV